MIIFLHFSILFTIFLRSNAQCPIIPTYIPCAHGSLPDEQGCPNGCDCIDGCSLITCPSDEYCHSLADGSARCCAVGNLTKCEYGHQNVLDSNNCPTSDCERQSDPRCPCRCPFNYNVLDSNGLWTCECENPCQYPRCPEGKECTFEYLGSISSPRAGYRIICKPKCTEVLCKLYCEHGFAKDCNGCKICQCNKPCKGVMCQKYHYCAVRTYQCIRKPCREPEAYCKPYCSPQELLLKDDDLINCDPNVKGICGEGNTCTTITKPDEHVCCKGVPVE